MANPRGCSRSSCDQSTGYGSYSLRIVASPAIASPMIAARVLESGSSSPCSCVYMFIMTPPCRGKVNLVIFARHGSSPHGCQVFAQRFNDVFLFSFLRTARARASRKFLPRLFPFFREGIRNCEITIWFDYDDRHLSFDILRICENSNSYFQEKRPIFSLKRRHTFISYIFLGWYPFLLATMSNR